MEIFGPLLRFQGVAYLRVALFFCRDFLNLQGLVKQLIFSSFFSSSKFF